MICADAAVENRNGDAFAVKARRARLSRLYLRDARRVIRQIHLRFDWSVRGDIHNIRASGEAGKLIQRNICDDRVECVVAGALVSVCTSQRAVMIRVRGALSLNKHAHRGCRAVGF